MISVYTNMAGFLLASSVVLNGCHWFSGCRLLPGHLEEGGWGMVGSVKISCSCILHFDVSFWHNFLILFWSTDGYTSLAFRNHPKYEYDITVILDLSRHWRLWQETQQISLIRELPCGCGPSLPENLNKIGMQCVTPNLKFLQVRYWISK